MNRQLLLILLIDIFFVPHTWEWSFEKQDKWPDVYCKKGIHQSPIDLVVENMLRGNDTPLVFENFEKTYNASLDNYGKMVGVVFNGDPLIVSGGGLQGTFQVDRFTFHWEAPHTLNGIRKPVESHFYMFNTLFQDFRDATKYNGLSILTILYELVDEDNNHLKPITDNLDKVEKASTSTDIQLKPESLLPADVTKFYRYRGSRLIPNCEEGVVWTIFEEICNISKQQLVDEDNNHLKPITDNLDKVEKASTSTDIQLKPESLLPADVTKFYRYRGSRLIPNCEEGVVWTIFEEICNISKQQDEKFKNLKGKDGTVMRGGHRDIQPLNDRKTFLITTN